MIECNQIGKRSWMITMKQWIKMVVTNAVANSCSANKAVSTGRVEATRRCGEERGSRGELRVVYVF